MGLPVAALAFTETVSWGVLYYSFAVLLVPMQADLGWSSATLSGAFSLALLVAGVAAPAVGGWLDRYGPRRVMTAGSLIGVAAVLAWANVESVVALYAAWAFIGVGMAATLYEPAMATVAGFAPRRRHTTLLVITTVAGFSTTIFSPLAASLTERHGWRTTVLILGAVLAVTVPVHLTALPGPRRAGGRDREPRPIGHEGSHASPDGFGRIVGVFAAAHAVAVAVTAHLVAFLVLSGLGPGTAASMAAAVGIAKVAGRVTVTLLLRVIAARDATAAVITLQAVGVAAPVLLRSMAGALVLVVLFGSSAGALTILRPAVIAERFGDLGFGRLNGRVGRASTMLGALAPAVLGLGTASAGGYTRGWLVLACVSLGAACVVVRSGGVEGAASGATS